MNHGLFAQAISQPNVDWHALSPELVITTAACIVLVADLFLPRGARWIAMPLSAAGLLGTLAAVVSLLGTETTTLAGTFEVDNFSLLFKALFCVLGLIILAISFHYFRMGSYYQGEYYFLLLCALLGGLVISSARDLISLFIALELISIPGIIMVALRKGDARSNEGALKFFLFSVLSSAVMLYGMSLVYGVTGSTLLSEIRGAIGADADQPIIVLSVFFVVVGFAFKISAVPFHFWAPDTYEGAPSPVAAFLSTVSKIGGFVGLLVLMFKAFPEVADTWAPVFAVLAVLTMTVGNLIALRQQNIIRLLAYSGIAQSGYILVCLALINPDNPDANGQAFAAAVIYLAIYGLMDLGAFAAAVAFARKGGTYFINDYSGLWQRSPVLALMLAAFLVSLAGAPPMAGLIAKLFVFLATIEAGVYWLAVVMGVNTVIAAWYYLAVVKRMFFDAPELEEPVEVP
ncbi:MAG: NADH-quinone oxidoreductase subunit N, partial [Actinomycetota bacterium]